MKQAEVMVPSEARGVKGLFCPNFATGQAISCEVRSPKTACRTRVPLGPMEAHRMMPLHAGYALGIQSISKTLAIPSAGNGPAASRPGRWS